MIVSSLPNIHRHISRMFSCGSRKTASNPNYRDIEKQTIGGGGGSAKNRKTNDTIGVSIVEVSKHTSIRSTHTVPVNKPLPELPPLPENCYLAPIEKAQQRKTYLKPITPISPFRWSFGSVTAAGPSRKSYVSVDSRPPTYCTYSASQRKNHR